MAPKLVKTEMPFWSFSKEADTDYLLARMINFLGAGFHSRAGFFAQQACEKYMKALMIHTLLTPTLSTSLSGSTCLTKLDVMGEPPTSIRYLRASQSVATG
jgi:HEPN domain-containing protein